MNTPEAGATRVLLVDDHPMVRAGLRAVLAGMVGVEVAGEASDGVEALAEVARLAPDIVITDIGMKGMNGLELAARLQTDHPATRVIVLSMHDGEEYVARALKNGASGYVLKDAAPLELELAMRAAMAGHVYLSPRTSRQVVDGMLGQRDGGSSSLASLSPRQREILRLMAEGNATKEIAYSLGISVKTVEAHRAQIMERLEIRDLAGLVRFAVRHGLVSVE
jgi:DNA-binding NarL/FixJ family response regulator